MYNKAPSLSYKLTPCKFKPSSRMVRALNAAAKVKNPDQVEPKQLKRIQDTLIGSAGTFFHPIMEDRQQARKKISGSYSSAYYNVLLHQGYSDAYTEKIWQSVERTIIPFMEENYHPEDGAKKKIATANGSAMAFMNDFDPLGIIHDPTETLIDFDTRPIMKGLLTRGAYHTASDKIFFYRYLVKFFDKDYMQEHKPGTAVDLSTTLKIFETSKNPDVEFKPGFEFDGYHCGHHREFNHETMADFQIINCLTQTEDVTKLTAHELCHLVNCRLAKLYPKMPHKIEQMFGFGKADYDTYWSSRIAYQDTGEKYLLNKEEFLSRNIEEKIAQTFADKASPLAPTAP